MTELLLASSNAAKVRELLPLLHGLGYRLCGLDRFPDVAQAIEDGETFAENARAKALHYASATGLDVLADDSGLIVDALNGAPGVHSARFAGAHGDAAANNALLLQRLAGVTDRSARFVCSLCLVKDGAVALELNGSCEGQILESCRGQGGFGYDPLFVPADPSAAGSTFAEMDAGRKAALSHRGAAVAALLRALSARVDGAAP